MKLLALALLIAQTAAINRNRKCDCSRRTSFLQAPGFDLLGPEAETGFKDNDKKTEMYNSEDGYKEEADWTVGGTKAANIWEPRSNTVKKITHAAGEIKNNGERYQDVYHDATRTQADIGNYADLPDMKDGAEDGIHQMAGECDCLLRYATRSRSELLHMEPNALFTLLNTTDVEVEHFKTNFEVLDKSCKASLAAQKDEWHRVTSAFNDTGIGAMAIMKGGNDESVIQQTASVMASKTQLEALQQNLTSNKAAIVAEQTILDQIVLGMPICKRICQNSQKPGSEGAWTEQDALTWECVRDGYDTPGYVKPEACTPETLNNEADTCKIHDPATKVTECLEAKKSTFLQTASKATLRGFPINNEGGFHNFLRNTILAIENAQRQLTYWRAKYETTQTNCTLWGRFYKERIESVKVRINAVRDGTTVESFNDPDVKDKLAAVRTDLEGAVAFLTNNVAEAATKLAVMQAEMAKLKNEISGPDGQCFKERRCYSLTIAPGA